MKKRLVVIDAHALGHTIKHSLGELTHDDLQVGIIYGFIFRVLFMARLFDTNRFCICWDSKTSKRKEIFPDYKKKPGELNEQEIYELSAVLSQFKILRTKVLPALGFQNNYIQEGMEGDDIVASLLFNYNLDEEEDKPVLISSDNDFYQLLMYCDMYILRTKKIFTAEDFLDKYNMVPSQWKEVKALAGCSGDGVPGVPGCGQTKAQSYIEHKLVKGAIFDRIITNPELIQLTRRLTTLPFEGTKAIYYKEDEFDIDKIINVLDAYDMRSLTSGKNYHTWTEEFCGN